MNVFELKYKLEDFQESLLGIKAQDETVDKIINDFEEIIEEFDELLDMLHIVKSSILDTTTKKFDEIGMHHANNSL